MNDLQRLDEAINELRGGFFALNVFISAALPFLKPDPLYVLALKYRAESDAFRDAMLNTTHSETTVHAFDRDVGAVMARIHEAGGHTRPAE